MHGTDEYARTKHPLIRIITLGEFALQRLVPALSQDSDESPRYGGGARSEWSNRGPAMALLKVLLCRANRPASPDELIDAISPAHGEINPTPPLESAASLLPRPILRT